MLKWKGVKNCAKKYIFGYSVGNDKSEKKEKVQEERGNKWKEGREVWERIVNKWNLILQTFLKFLECKSKGPRRKVTINSVDHFFFDNARRHCAFLALRKCVELIVSADLLLLWYYRYDIIFFFDNNLQKKIRNKKINIIFLLFFFNQCFFSRA